MNKWISIKEKLPDGLGFFRVLDMYKDVECIAAYNPKTETWQLLPSDGLLPNIVTHWKEIEVTGYILGSNFYNMTKKSIGTWKLISISDWQHKWECSVCKKRVDTSDNGMGEIDPPTPFCPYCGAYMRGDLYE